MSEKFGPDDIDNIAHEIEEKTPNIASSPLTSIS
jgi:hypothetical protein